MTTKYNTIKPLPSSLPLTSENLKNYQVKKPLKEMDTERFCQELFMMSPPNTMEPSSFNYSAKRQKKRPSSASAALSSGNSHRRSTSIKSSQSQHRDHTCMESPRLLPFPYHNDSLFLPTVEQHRHLRKVRSIASIHSHHQQQQHLLSTSSSISRPSSPVLPRRQLSAPPKLTKKYSDHRSQKYNNNNNNSRPSSPVPITTDTGAYIKSNDSSTSRMDHAAPNSTMHKNVTGSKKNTIAYRLWCKKVFKFVKKVSIFH